MKCSVSALEQESVGFRFQFIPRLSVTQPQHIGSTPDDFNSTPFRTSPNLDDGTTKGGREITVGPETEFECRGKEGEFPHPRYCHYYYNCKNDNVTMVRCPEGQYFDVERGYCEEWYMVTCGDRLTPEEVDSTMDDFFSTGHPRTQPTAKPEEKTTQEPATEKPKPVFKCPTKEGNYPHERNCGKYYRCVNSEPEEILCPKGYLYDLNNGICNAEEDTNCGDRIHPDDKPDEPDEDRDKVVDPDPEFDCTTRHGCFTHEMFCKWYYYCHDKRPEVRECSGDQYFDSVRNKCLEWWMVFCDNRSTPDYGSTTVPTSGTDSSTPSGTGVTDSGNRGTGMTDSGNRGTGITDSGNRGTGITDSGNRGTGITDSGNRGTGITDSGNRGTGITDSGNRGTGITDSGNHGTGATDSGNRGTGVTDSGNRGTGATDSGNRGTGVTDNGNRGTGVTDSDNRGTGVTDNGNRGTGITDSGNRGTGATDSGNRGTGVTDSGNRGTGVTDSDNRGTGATDNGNRGTGVTDSGNRGTGVTDNGNRGTGVTDSGNRGTGATDNGNRGTGVTDSGNRGTGVTDSGNRGTGATDIGNRGTGITDNRSRDTERTDRWSRGTERTDSWSRGTGITDNRGTGVTDSGNQGTGRTDRWSRGTEVTGTEGTTENVIVTSAKPIEDLCKEEDGDFAHPDQCREYYTCKDGDYTLNECPRGTMFDNTMRICFNEDKVDCGTRFKPTQAPVTDDCDEWLRTSKTSNGGNTTPSLKETPEGTGGTESSHDVTKNPSSDSTDVSGRTGSGNDDSTSSNGLTKDPSADSTD
ncbi:uncharacterized protein LOC129220193, partial [Uloborus diversus]|uniref:uncharacterized protein LOC129220193 n=1 Tax=Uloborus diversus TaxID=327109 RepID=UPI002409E426